jgi:hypothetical protein
MDDLTRTQLEAATFRRLLKHLQEHSDVQNIELMLTADFCRNCLAKWYSAEAKTLGLDLDYPEAQNLIYGMPYSEWKASFQKEATPEQLQAFEARQKLKGTAS